MAVFLKVIGSGKNSVSCLTPRPTHSPNRIWKSDLLSLYAAGRWKCAITEVMSDINDSRPHHLDICHLLHVRLGATARTMDTWSWAVIINED